MDEIILVAALFLWVPEFFRKRLQRVESVPLEHASQPAVGKPFDSVVGRSPQAVPALN